MKSAAEKSLKHVTPMDLRALTDERSPKVRRQLAAKIAMGYRLGHFTPAEADIASDIFRVLVKDAEVHVRQALSEQLAYSAAAPHDVIATLAMDDAAVAAPVLEYSSVLTEDDLIAIVNSSKEIIKLRAVARRGTVPADLASCLVETHNELVLADLFKNKGAVIEERQLMPSWDYINSSPSLLETLVHRGGLPVAVAEKLFGAVSDALKTLMAAQYPFAPFMHKAMRDIQEWKMLGLVPPGDAGDPHDDELAEALVDELYDSGRLTHSMLVRALCQGNLAVFEAGMAKMAGVPRVNARILLLMDGSALGFAAMCKASGMPEGFMDAMRVLLKISLEESECGHARPADFRKRVLDRIFAEGYNKRVENMEYLLTIIGGKIVAAA